MSDSLEPKTITIPQRRADLYQFLLDIPGGQFEAVLFDLNPPRANIPPSNAARSDRVSALMTWVESPSAGPGIEVLRASLDYVLNTLSGSQGTKTLFTPSHQAGGQNINSRSAQQLQIKSRFKSPIFWILILLYFSLFLGAYKILPLIWHQKVLNPLEMPHQKQ
ncbi:MULTISPECIES: hypothetical protein [Cyanophyceae]|uniref:Uncharacterized protein n=1 Tax=Leptolyngbya subtilissima DQ-A4 TaxID=2933933 RepID=A0ABV0K9M4_9CYAN|nr:hypothetical protein [Nodosilinea sp. FACHB-141]MBD2110819.1 hypothetical protein [Nodosilinea sp. FACHB-141]